MALSVYAFGTGGKRKRIFQDIYFSAEETDGVGVLYTKTGEYSAVLKIENPVQKYSADIDSYYDFTHLFTALAQTLGEGYAIHKQDIFVRKQFASEPADGQEFLSASYFRYFKGRPYTDSLCYLTITQEAKKSRLFSFDNKKWRDFLVKIRKVHDLRATPDVSKPVKQCCDYIRRHILQPLELSQIARHVGYSEYYLSKRFNREMGIRVVDFIKDERINLAKIWLVTTSKSVDEISETLQFNSRNYFGKVFCEKVGMTPSAYRKQLRDREEENQ